MKAIITSASEVDINGQQNVSFDIVKSGDVLVSTSVSGDVDTIRDRVQSVVSEYQLKFQSDNKLEVGDEIEV